MCVTLPDLRAGVCACLPAGWLVCVRVNSRVLARKSACWRAGLHARALASELSGVCLCWRVSVLAGVYLCVQACVFVLNTIIQTC